MMQNKASCDTQRVSPTHSKEGLCTNHKFKFSVQDKIRMKKEV